MKTFSAYGLQLLKKLEGCKLNAYLDSAGIPTIGVGHIKDVMMGDKITMWHAEDMLRRDLVRFEKCVNRQVRVPINQNQYDALVCFAFNLGCTALRTSTLLKRLNVKKYAEAADQFLRWNKVRIKGVLTVSRGITNRRKTERSLFLGKKA